MIVRIYTGADGQSHFEDMDLGDAEIVDLKSGAPMSIRRVPNGAFFDWHTSDRHYAFFLEGQVEVVIGDGTVRHLGVGDAVLEEDSTGQGHTTRFIGGPAMVVNVTLPD